MDANYINVPTTTNHVVPVVPISIPTRVSHGEKLEKFNGNDFKRWQQKMLLNLTKLNLAKFLREDAPVCSENEADCQVVAAVDAWKHSDFLCKNYILNGLDNTLYNVYSPIKTTREPWESLDRKYKTEDAKMKKFVVGRFLDYKMVDSKTIISQVQDLQVILHEIHAEWMVLSESFQVAAIIEKLPPNWKDFNNYLKHKCKEIKLEDLIVRLRIEEDNIASEKKIGYILQTFAPYTPQQNGIAERKNRTLKEMMNAMLISSGLHQNLWGEAFLSANYILNKLPHKKLDNTSYSLWKGRIPSYKYLKLWGC